MAFFYTMDVTEQKLQEELLKRIAAHDYDSVTEVDILRDAYRMLFFNGSRNRIPATGCLLYTSTGARSPKRRNC